MLFHYVVHANYHIINITKIIIIIMYMCVYIAQNIFHDYYIPYILHIYMR